MATHSERLPFSAIGPFTGTSLRMGTRRQESHGKVILHAVFQADITSQLQHFFLLSHTRASKIFTVNITRSNNGTGKGHKPCLQSGLVTQVCSPQLSRRLRLEVHKLKA